MYYSNEKSNSNCRLDPGVWTYFSYSIEALPCFSYSACRSQNTFKQGGAFYYIAAAASSSHQNMSKHIKCNGNGIQYRTKAFLLKSMKNNIWIYTVSQWPKWLNFKCNPRVLNYDQFLRKLKREYTNTTAQSRWIKNLKF